MATGDVTRGGVHLRWDLVESDVPQGEQFTVRVALPRRRKDLLIAVDAVRRRHILLEIPLGEPYELSERASRGISVQTLQMKTDTGEFCNFIDIICLEANCHAVLDIILGEIADALDAGASILRVSLVQNILSKWRRFWSPISQEALARERQIGLFGELWFLMRWLEPSIGLRAAIEMWRGPFGARNDFESNLVGVEVKTSSRVDKTHIIHGLEQLLEPADGVLFLMSICVRDEASAADSLPSLIRDIRQKLCDDHDTLSRFDNSLYSVGYDDSLESEYEKLKLRVRSEELYRVANEFPRLVPESLKSTLPPGIGQVSYELRLDGALPWRVACRPEGAQHLLREFLEG